MAFLYITDASGRQWHCELPQDSISTIGRAPHNTVVLNDPRASRYHAHIKFQNGSFIIIDGKVGGGRSANHVLIGNEQRLEHVLADGDRIQIGASELRFDQRPQARSMPSVNYDDRPLGHTHLLVSASDVLKSLQSKSMPSVAEDTAPGQELEALRRKAEILALLYEMSKTLGSVFNLEAIFDKATEVIFSATPADRVVALIVDEAVGGSSSSGGNEGEPNLQVVAMRVREERHEARAKRQPIGRTITRKVMRERAVLMSQDATADMEFAGVHSIVSQGVHATICAPLVAETNVHGALYADCLDTLKTFSRDDLELVSAVAAQTAVAVENARAHQRLAREEVARANYERFLPPYVVQQILEHPESFKLGGVGQTITVLFADIRGFTRLSEHTAPEKVVQLLNRYFTAMSDIIFAHGGTLDKYLGDGLMALFGAPTATPQDACNAVAASVAMQRQMHIINDELEADGLGQMQISIGIGLHTGEAVVGYIGSERRSEYTAIGDTVNLAQRLESNAEGGQVLVSEATAIAAADNGCPLLPRPALTVRNRVQPVPLFEVDWKHGNALVVET